MVEHRGFVMVEHRGFAMDAPWNTLTSNMREQLDERAYNACKYYANSRINRKYFQTLLPANTSNASGIILTIFLH